MGQLLLLLGKLAALIVAIAVPLAVTFVLTLPHATFPVNAVGTLKCYFGNGVQHVC